MIETTDPISIRTHRYEMSLLGFSGAAVLISLAGPQAEKFSISGITFQEPELIIQLSFSAIISYLLLFFVWNAYDELRAWSCRELILTLRVFETEIDGHLKILRWLQDQSGFPYEQDKDLAEKHSDAYERLIKMLKELRNKRRLIPLSMRARIYTRMALVSCLAFSALILLNT